MIKIALDFPSSPQISSLAADIVASTIPGCSEAELQSLQEQENMVYEAIIEVEESIEEVTSIYEGMDTNIIKILVVWNI